MSQEIQVTIPLEVKEKFDKRRGEGEYDRWLKRFMRNCNSFTGIAIEEGVTREAIRITYKKYFAPYLPHKTGRQRIRLCTLHKIEINYRRVEHQKFPTQVLKEVAEQAKTKGFMVKLKPHKSGRYTWKPNKCALVINGKTCHINYHRKSKPETNNLVHVCVSIRNLELYDFYIFYIEVENFPKIFFIIPQETLCTFLYSEVTKKRKYFYLPLEIKKLNKWSQKIDWNQFREAWHLLEV